MHGISTPLPMVYRTPYPWYFDPLPMVFWPYALGISTSLPMIYRTPYQW
jgi:hypothetical protein